MEQMQIHIFQCSSIVLDVGFGAPENVFYWKLCYCCWDVTAEFLSALLLSFFGCIILINWDFSMKICVVEFFSFGLECGGLDDLNLFDFDTEFRFKMTKITTLTKFLNMLYNLRTVSFILSSNQFSSLELRITVVIRQTRCVCFWAIKYSSTKLLNHYSIESILL